MLAISSITFILLIRENWCSIDVLRLPSGLEESLKDEFTLPPPESDRKYLKTVKVLSAWETVLSYPVYHFSKQPPFPREQIAPFVKHCTTCRVFWLPEVPWGWWILPERGGVISGLCLNCVSSVSDERGCSTLLLIYRPWSFAYCTYSNLLGQIRVITLQKDLACHGVLSFVLVFWIIPSDNASAPHFRTKKWTWFLYKTKSSSISQDNYRGSTKGKKLPWCHWLEPAKSSKGPLMFS